MILHQNPATGYWTDFGPGYVLGFLHRETECAGRGCAIHNHPTNHPLKGAPLNWREGAAKLERICKHGIGHDDHDSVLFLKSDQSPVSREAKEWVGIHGCDGCCV